MTAAAVAVISNPAVLSDIESLFTGSSYDATHQQIIAWIQTIQSDPAGAALVTPTTPASVILGRPAAQAWLWLRCWAGDQTILASYNAANITKNGGGAPATVCGCEVDHGCRQDAQTAVAQLAPMIAPFITSGAPTTGALSNTTQASTGANGAVLAVTTGGVTTVSGAGNTAATLAGAGVVPSSTLLLVAAAAALLLVFVVAKR